MLYAGLVAAQYLGTPALPLVDGAEALQPPRVALYTVGLNVFGFIAVAALSGYLSEGLRRVGRELEQASRQIAGLQAFSEYAIEQSRQRPDDNGSGSAACSRLNRAGETITRDLRRSPRSDGPRSRICSCRARSPGCSERATARPPLPRLEYQFTHADGRQIELGISTAVLMTPRGESGFVITFQDVTEARRLEREARMQQRLAAVGEMAAGIAHEIRNPLASMSGSIQILRQELPLTDEQAQLMDIVLRESERLNDTIRSFLAYARPQRNAATRIDVRSVVTETATLLQNSPERQEEHRISVRRAG